MAGFIGAAFVPMIVAKRAGVALSLSLKYAVIEF